MEALFEPRAPSGATPPPQGLRVWIFGGGLHIRCPSDILRERLATEPAGVIVTVVADFSGSMVPHMDRLKKTLASIARAAIESGTEEQLQIVVFGTTAATITAEQASRLDARRLDSDLLRVFNKLESSTSYTAAIANVRRYQTENPGRRHVVLFMTDGQPDPGGASGCKLDDTDFRPILFSPHTKGTAPEPVVTALWNLQKQVDGRSDLTREEFRNNNLKVVNENDDLSVVLQIARGQLVRHVTVSCEQGRGFALTLASGNEDAVGFMPLSVQIPAGLNRITVTCSSRGGHSFDLEVPLVNAPTVDEPQASSLLELEAVLTGTMAVDRLRRQDVITRAMDFLRSREADDDACRIIKELLQRYEQNTAMEGAAAIARLTSTLPQHTSDLKSLVDLVRAIGPLACVGSSARRAAIRRVQRITACGCDADTVRKISIITEYIKQPPSGQFPRYIVREDDLYLAAHDGRSPAILLDAPGCRAETQTDLQDRIARALNHADAARAYVSGMLTQASLDDTKRFSLEPMRQRVVVVIPTSNPQVLQALATLNLGAMMLGELVPLPPQGCDGYLAAASAIFEEDCMQPEKIESDTCIRIATWIHFIQLYKAVAGGFQFVYKHNALCPIAASRPMGGNPLRETSWVRSLRTALMFVSAFHKEISLHALLVELVRKRVAAISTRRDSHACLGQAVEDLMRATGVDAAVKQFCVDQLVATTSLADVERVVRDWSTNAVPLPESIDASAVHAFLDAFCNAETGVPHEDRYSWEESPSLRSFLKSYENALRLKGIIGDADVSANGWVSEECIRSILDPQSRTGAVASVGRELAKLDGVKLFAAVYQTLQGVRQNTMGMLPGVKADITGLPVEILPPQARVAILRRGDPGSDFDAALSAMVIRGDGGFRRYITPALALTEGSHTRAALLETGTDPETCVTDKGSLPCTPRSRRFARRVNGLCKKFGVRDGSIDGSTRATWRDRDSGSVVDLRTDPNYYWVKRGVTMVNGRVTHLGGVHISNMLELRNMCSWVLAPKQTASEAAEAKKAKKAKKKEGRVSGRAPMEPAAADADI